MRSRYFPFHTFGLRRNPFGALTREEWAAVAVPPEPVAAALEAESGHVQILGEKGRGKTTALLWLTARLADRDERATYEYLPEGRHRFLTDPSGLACFLLDEAQRLSRRERRRLIRAAGEGTRLIFSSHLDLAKGFARHGLPLATIRLEETITRQQFEAVLTRRLAYFALADDPGVSFTPGAVDVLWTAFGADLRALEACLYEVFQALDAPGPVTRSTLTRWLGPPPD